MPSFRLVGAVAVKVLPDTDDFREKLKRQIDKELAGYEPKVEVDVEANRPSMKTTSAELEKFFKTLNDRKVTVKLDADAREAKKQVKGLKVSLQELKDMTRSIDVAQVFDPTDSEKMLEQLRFFRKELGLITGKGGLADGQIEYSGALPWTQEVKHLSALVGDYQTQVRKAMDATRQWSKGFDTAGMKSIRKEIGLMRGESEKLGKISNKTIADYNRQLGLVQKLSKEQREATQAGLEFDDARLKAAQTRLESLAEETKHWRQMKGMQEELAKVTDASAVNQRVQAKENLELQEQIADQEARRAKLAEQIDGIYTTTTPTIARMAKLGDELAKSEYERRKELMKSAKYAEMFGGGMKEYQSELRHAEASQKRLADIEAQRLVYANKTNDLYDYGAAALMKLARAGDEAAKAEIRRRNEVVAQQHDTQKHARTMGTLLDQTKAQNEDNARIELSRLVQHRELTKSAEQHLKAQQNLAKAWRGEISYLNALNEVYDVRRQPQEIDIWMKLAQLEYTEAQIDWLTRDREVDIDVVLRKQTAKSVSDFLQTSSGWRAYRRAIDDVIESFTELDDTAMAMAKTTGLIGSLGIAGGAAGGSMLSLGSSLLDVVKVSAGAPAVLAALGSAVYVATKAFDNFGAAVSGDADALELLPPRARRAAQSLGNYLRYMGRDVQNEFWTPVSDNFERFLTLSGQTMKDMMDGIASELGESFSGIADAMLGSFQRGDFAKFSKGVIDMFDNMEKAGFHMFDGLTRSIAEFSPLLGNVGQGITDAMEKWNDFTKTAAQNGNWTAWAVEGAEQLGGLSDATSNLVAVFHELGQIAISAGGPDLRDLGDAMEYVNEAVDGQFFQQNFKTILEGAFEGSTAAAEGFRDLGTAILQESGWIKESLIDVGDTVGNLVGDISDVFTNDMFQGGVSKLIDDMGTAVNTLKPMWSDLGQVMGEAATIGGEVIKVLADVAVNVMDAFAGVPELTYQVAEIIPVLGDFANTLIDLLQIPVHLLSDVLAGMLGVFNALPGPVQAGALALAAGALAMGKVDKIAGVAKYNISTFAKTMNETERAAWRQQSALTRLGSTWVTTGRNMDAAARSTVLAQQGMTRGERALYQSAYRIRDSGALMRTAGQQAATGFSQLRGSVNGLNPALATVGPVMRDASGAMDNFRSAAGNLGRGVFGPIRSGISGVTSMLGGPWMIGFMAAGLAVVDFISDVKASQGAFDQIEGSIREFGSTSREVADEIARAFEDGIIPADKIGTQFANWWDDFEPFRNNLTEAMDEIGISSEDMSRAITGSQQDYQNELSKIAAEHDGMWNNNNSALKAMAEMRTEFIRGSLEAKNNATAMGLTETQAIKLRSAMETLQDGTGDTSTELNAMKLSLDTLRGGQRSAREGAMQLAETQSEVSSALKDVIEKAETSGSVVRDANGKINTSAGEAGVSMSKMFRIASDGSVVLNEQNAHARDFADAMTEWGDASLTAGKQAYDAAIQSGEGQAEATRKGIAAMDESKGAMKGWLTELGITGKQAESLMQEFTGKDWEIELTFMGKTEEFLTAKNIVEASGSELDGKNFVSFLKANPDMALDDIKRLAVAGMTWEESKFTSNFGIDTGDSDAKFDAAIKRGETFDNKDFTASLTGNDTAFLDTVLTATAKGEELDSKEFEARFGANDAVLNEKFIEANAKGLEFGSEEWVAHLDANNEGFAEAFLTAEAMADGLTGTDIEAYVLANIDDYQAGLTEAEQLKMNLDGTSAEVSVDAQTDTYFLKMRGVELAADGLDGREIQATLGLNDEEWAMLADGTYGAILESYNGKSATAHLKEEGSENVKQAASTTEEAVKRNNQTVTATVLAQTEGAQGALAITKDKADAVDASDPTVTADIQDNASLPLEGLNEDAAKLDQANPDPAVSLSGNPAAVREDLDHIQRKLDDIDNKNPDSSISVNTGSAITDLDTLIARLDTFDTKEAWADARVNGSGLDSDIGSANAKLDAFDFRTVWADLRATVAGLDGDVSLANGKINSFDSRTVWADLRATVAGLDGDVSLANGKINSFDSRTVWADLRATTAGLDGDVSLARGKLNGFDAIVKWADMRATTAGLDRDIASARGKLNGYDAITKWADLRARNETAGGISAARGALNGWANDKYQATLTSRDETQSGVNSARDRMRTVARDKYEATLKARDETRGAAESARSRLRDVARGHYEAVMRVDPGPAQSGAWAAQNAINAVRGKTVYIDVVTRKSNNNGGLEMGGQWQFNNGGMMPPTVQKFATGGEYHMAHISQAQQTYRIWSEKETGGEAYIPLAMSKRTRSTAILKRVAQLFGYEVVDSDTMSGVLDGGQGGGGEGGSGIQFNIVNNNPIAEATSKTINRSLAYAGFYGG